MKIGTKIFVSYLLVIGIGFFYLTNTVLKNISKRYLEGVEESLVDEARILSHLVSYDMERGSFPGKKLRAVFDKIYEDSFRARIYKLTKKEVDLRIYITDDKGILIFDSQKLDPPGTDYSSWIDVGKTLKGMYGARSTDSVAGKPETRVLYVAAPIMVKSELKGVLSVAKPSTNINIFIHDTAQKVIKFSYAASFAFIVLIFLIAYFITRPINKLTSFANDIREGKRVPLPKLGNDEIGIMGKAFESMLSEIEGKKYVEEYVHTLTHEIKSPLSAIRGACELLEEDMPDEQRARFLKNIDTESERIEKIVTRMLELSSLENRKALNIKRKVDITSIVNEAVESFGPVLKTKGVMLKTEVESDIQADCDPFIIRQVFTNLIQNAVEFSPENGVIHLSLKEKDGKVEFEVIDEGPGIPDFASTRIFEKFYSLNRPDTGKKSTGLGLSFVKEAVLLHGGEVKIDNIEETGSVKGVRAVVIIK